MDAGRLKGASDGRFCPELLEPNRAKGIGRERFGKAAEDDAIKQESSECPCQGHPLLTGMDEE